MQISCCCLYIFSTFNEPLITSVMTSKYPLNYKLWSLTPSELPPAPCRWLLNYPNPPKRLSGGIFTSSDLSIYPLFVSESGISDEDLEYFMNTIIFRSRDDHVIRYEDMIRLDQEIFINSLILMIRVEGNPEWTRITNQ